MEASWLPAGVNHNIQLSLTLWYRVLADTGESMNSGVCVRIGVFLALK